MPNGITKKQQSLVHFAIKELSAGATLDTALLRGAEEAGYSQPSGGKQAYSTNPAVKQALDRSVAHYQEEFERYLPVATPTVLVELLKICVSDITDFFDNAGVILPMSEWPRESTSLIKEVEFNKDTGALTKLRLHDKLTAIPQFLKATGKDDAAAGDGNQTINNLFVQIQTYIDDNNSTDIRPTPKPEAAAGSDIIEQVGPAVSDEPTEQALADAEPVLDSKERRPASEIYSKLAASVFGDTPTPAPSSIKEPPARD
jgi:hypothetical protein|tara:strand:+ start:1580 stop:2353 length:774 start_codon:yes stop_codon:yes gene_type:complete